MILAIIGFVVLLGVLAGLVALLWLVRSLPGMGFLNPLVEPVWDGLADMWAYKTRTVLQTLGVMLGSASVIVTVALLMGGREEDRAFLEETGGVTTLEVRKAEGGKERLFARDMGSYGITIDDVWAVKKAVEPLGAVVYASRSFQGELFTPDGNDETTVWGITPEYLTIEKLTIAEGRTLTYGDVDASQAVIVLGSNLREKLFGNSPALGKYVTFRGGGWRGASKEEAALAMGRPPRRYLVVGTLEEKFYSRGDDGENWLDWMNDLAYVPLTTALHREIGGREVSFVSVDAMSLENVRPVKAALDEALVRRHHGSRPYAIFDRAERLEEWEERGMMYDAAIGGAGAISLLVGGIVIMNILLASLTQRIREVGIRKALGARNFEIFVQFLTESVIVAGMGGVGGALLGASLSGVVSSMMEQQLILTPFVMFLGVFVSMTVGFVFGIYPAVRAALLDPVVALRYE